MAWRLHPILPEARPVAAFLFNLPGAIVRVDRTLLLINPNARSGDTDLSDIEGRFAEHGAVVAPECDTPEKSRAALRQHAGSAARVVVGGGDGSLNTLLPDLLEAGLPVGILPLGTANDFARSLGIENLDAAIDAVLAGKTRKVDVGVVNDHLFLNAVGIGLGPRINRDLDKESKSALGVLAYLFHSIRNLRRHRGMRATVECDDGAVTLKSLQITIASGIHYGGGMTIASDARLDDGMLDVLVIRPLGLMSLLAHVAALRTGNIRDDEQLRTFKTSTVRVRTRRPSDVTADGEFVTRTPVECRVLKQVLEVYAPDTAAEA